MSPLSLPGAGDVYAASPLNAVRLQHGSPFSFEQAAAYVAQQWAALGLGQVPPPQLIRIKAGDTPAYARYQLAPLEEWQAMQAQVPPGLLRQKLNAEGKPCIELQNVILLPEEALSKGLFGILAHELHHATMYPKLAAAMMAGMLPPDPGETIPAAYAASVRQAGFDRNPSMIAEGVYRAKLAADSETYGPALVQAGQKLSQLETSGNARTFAYLKQLEGYQEAFARYFSSPEELQGFLIYADITRNPAFIQTFRLLSEALHRRDRQAFSQAIGALCAMGIPEGHLQGRVLPPVKPYVIDAIFAEWGANDRLRARLGLGPLHLR